MPRTLSPQSQKWGALWAIVLFFGWVIGGIWPAAYADDADAAGGEYHTPIAGEPVQTTVMGRSIEIPGRDRSNQAVLNLGGTLYAPKLGDNFGYPLFALYLKRVREEGRLRAVLSGFLNDVDVARSLGHFEIVGRIENTTIPLDEEGIRNNEEVKEASIKWGNLSAYLGGGLRYPVAPYKVDNDLRIQLMGRVGYLYSARTSDTGEDVRLPPDTMLYGVKLRGRYDGFLRNILDLPHRGTAAGFDLDFVHRHRWADFGNSLVTFTKADTQDYAKFTVYGLAAFGIPGLSEKNTILTSIHAGVAEKKRTDRFNAFRLSSALFASETDDLYRPDYPGALFTENLAAQYLLLNIEYRREIFFFLYFTLRGSFIWADRSTIIGGNQIGFKSDNGQSASAALTSGFLWNSRLHLQYAWDSGFLRDGESGSSILLFWSKPL